MWIFVNESEPFGFVARSAEGKSYLVFRGTESATDWLSNLDTDPATYPLVSGYVKVHDGFLKLYESIRDDMFNAFDEVGEISDLWVTGHSLGCGLSTVAIPDLLHKRTFNQVEHYNFASPRVGDPEFTDKYNTNCVKTFRVVNTCDIVPQAPPSVVGKWLFKHIAIPVDYTAQYGSIVGNHSVTGSYIYALDHPDCPEKS